MIKTNEIIKADVFIVPNGSFKVTEKTFEWVRSDLFRIFNSNFAHIGDEKFLDQTWIEVWFVTRGNDESNWTDHDIDGYSELRGWKPLTQYLPKSLFENHKEGEVITINLPIWRRTPAGDEYSCVKVELCLKQQGYRYERFGKFEEVLKRV